MFNDIPQFVSKFDQKKIIKKSTNVKTQNNEKRCSQCFSLISRGKRHKCNKTSLVQNLTKSISGLDDIRQKEHVVSKLIQNIANEKNNLNDQANKKHDILVSLSQNRGKLLNVSVRPSERKDPVISSESFKKMQTELDLSKRKVLSLATFIRSETKNTKILERDFKKKFEGTSHLFDELFESRTFDFVHEESGTVKECKRNAVLCKNIPTLINHVIEHQISIQPSYNDTLKKISNSRKSNHNNRFKDSGVKKIFIIFIAPSTQENYTNVAIIWETLKLNEVLGTVSTDLKLANILTGLMTSSSSHPCTWCDSFMKNLDSCGLYRTVKKLYEKLFKLV